MQDEEVEFSDNLLPNSSSAFIPQADPETTEEINQERAMILSATPLLEELLSWFDTQIAAMDSIDGLDPDQIDLRSQIIGRQIAKSALSSSRGHLQSMVDNYVPKHD